VGCSVGLQQARFALYPECCCQWCACDSRLLLHNSSPPAVRCHPFPSPWQKLPLLLAHQLPLTRLPRTPAGAHQVEGLPRRPADSVCGKHHQCSHVNWRHHCGAGTSANQAQDLHRSQVLPLKASASWHVGRPCYNLGRVQCSAVQ
jgi:hypothetical protein